MAGIELRTSSIDEKMIVSEFHDWNPQICNFGMLLKKVLNSWKPQFALQHYINCQIHESYKRGGHLTIHVVQCSCEACSPFLPYANWLLKLLLSGHCKRSGCVNTIYTSLFLLSYGQQARILTLSRIHNTIMLAPWCSVVLCCISELIKHLYPVPANQCESPWE